MQIPAILAQYSTLTNEQKEKIADGPGLEDFISGPDQEVPTATAPLKSKSGERYTSGDVSLLFIVILMISYMVQFQNKLCEPGHSVTHLISCEAV